MVSLKFNNVYINDYHLVIGPNNNLNLKNIDYVMDDYYFGEQTFEQAQIKMCSHVLRELSKNQNIDLIIGGDLSNQLTSTYYAVNRNKLKVSTLGIYSACSTFLEGLILSSLFIERDKNKKIINITSSHVQASERQFRFPVEYGNLRNKNSTLTATASVGCVISGEKSKIKVLDATIGYPDELGITDPNYVGAIMAPSAGNVIMEHLKNHNYNINDFDLVLTGDLGSTGLSILKEILSINGYEKINNIVDAGASLYKVNREINDGASGPAVLPTYLFYNILNNKKYKKILLVSTGSLHSKNLTNQKKPIPAISHAVTIEVIR